MRRNARRKGARLIEFTRNGLVIVDLNEFIIVVSLASLTLELRVLKGRKMPSEMAFLPSLGFQTFLTGGVFKETARICQVMHRLISRRSSPDTRIAASSSINAVSFSSARTTKRFPSP